MIKHKLYFLIAGIVLAVPTLACGTVGVYDPEATQVAMESTVVALQATISALEEDVSQPESPRIIVVTATSTPGSAQVPESSTVVAASSLGQTINLTPTPTDTPITISPQEKIVTVVVTLTPTPTPESYPDAPITLEPPEGTVVEEGREILLHWSWNGILGPNEHFDIKIKPDGQDRSAYVAWEEGLGHNLQANLSPGRYYWSVQIVKGYYKNDVKAPENRVFEAFLSPESEPRLIIVAERDDDDHKPTPTRTSTPEPTSTPVPPTATPTP